METINVRATVNNAVTASDGELLFTKMESVFKENKKALLYFDEQCNMSSSFLNGCFTPFIEKYGFDNFRNHFSIKATKATINFIKKHVYTIAETSV